MQPVHADSFLAFPPLFIFAKCSPTHNRGNISLTKGLIRCFAVGIMMDGGLEDSAKIVSIVWVAIAVVCLILSHLGLKVFRHR